jgi:hypothetical protein
VNLLIAWIYWNQLTQMREATQAATKSANTATDSFEINNGNFDRTMSQMLNQITAERSQIRVDQRAWLWVDIPNPPQWEIGKPIVSTMKVLDSGKTVALNVHADIKVELLPMAQPPDFVYKTGHRRCALNTGFIFPNASNAIVRCFVFDNKTTKKPHILTADDQQLSSAGKVYVAYHGLVRYQDIFGVSHWVQFCEASFDPSLFQNPKGPEEVRGIDICQRYEKTDSNPE